MEVATANGPERPWLILNVSQKMKIAYFLEDMPVELSTISALLTQDTMKATGAAVTDRLRARLGEEELRDVTV